MSVLLEIICSFFHDSGRMSFNIHSTYNEISLEYFSILLIDNVSAMLNFTWYAILACAETHNFSLHYFSAKSVGSRKRRLHCNICLALKRGPVITAVITSKNSPPLLIPPTANISLSLAGRIEGILIKSSEVSQRDRRKRLKLVKTFLSSIWLNITP